ncbi:pyruvate, water dikinase regulatory protein [Dethiobacter alkaliphilus]|uniref:pyruvate, water dikinase regulatory protein n=1 Tax=Dethiobacter alkaliphilus TaxID=427926 RepID=UPI00222668C9|nr:pyruvate, water dikinase regulatory protein [Dethiobacter alkaliphilus]MCW3489352.1 kinase/pyrophosphorylase [Dethiobacter alkaliphilus]
MQEPKRKPVVYLISDSIGETAEFVVKAVASQFNSGHVDIKRTPFVTDPDTIMDVVEEAAQANGMIAYTLVLPELRRVIREESKKRDLITVDVMGPMMDAFGQLLGIDPHLEPGLVRRMDEEYFRRVAAIEFAVKYDDGKDPRGLLLADVVLIGVSRTSKTPLSMYLAHKRLKGANLPLVPEVEPPEELFWVPPNKVIGLTISPQQLNEIRQERLKALGLHAQANYANMERILEELEYAEAIMRKVGCPIFDVTNKAVEEVANKILQVIREEQHDG